MRTIPKLILVRTASGLVTLWVVSLVIFLGVSMLPGDIATEVLGQSATPATIAAFRNQLGLDLPLAQRYLVWLSNLFHGDLGVSLANGQPIVDLIGSRLKNTLALAALAAVMSVPVD